MRMFKNTLIAGSGGFFGAVLRVLCENFAGILYQGFFPFGTFLSNMAGSFLIGLFYGWVTKRNFITKNLNIFLITGLCGGFTTFSSFSKEMVNLLQDGKTETFLFYMLFSTILGILMVVAGIVSVTKNKNLFLSKA